MLCRSPYMVGVLPCPCGRCLPCRIARRRVWTFRMMLESFKHGDSCFVTLTYDDEHLPKDGSLDKSHYRNWLKRLRKVLEPEKVRYFLVGEYGDVSLRPHFHVALFGVSALVAGGADGFSGVVKGTWPFGFTFVGELNSKTAGYVAGYVTQKIVRFQRDRIKGLVPEFSRMSLRPGIGCGAMGDVARVLQERSGVWAFTEEGDVPYSLRFDGKLLPIGKYLRGKLRLLCGFPSSKPPEGAGASFASELREMLKGSFEVAANSSKSVSEIVVDRDLQKLRNVEARFRVHDSRRIL